MDLIGVFKNWPGCAGKGLMALAAGWMWLWAMLYFHLGEVDFRTLVAGVGTCLFLVTTYRWAWVFALMGSAMAILYNLSFVLAYWGPGRITALGYLVVVGCFSLALFFLTRKESSGFFKKNFASPGKDPEPDPPAAPPPTHTKNNKKS